MTSLSDQETFRLLPRYHLLHHRLREPIGNLSPGERARLLLAIFSANAVNVLLLDEPTNHLDIEALEALEDVLKNYKGTVILISTMIADSLRIQSLMSFILFLRGVFQKSLTTTYISRSLKETIILFEVCQMKSNILSYSPEEHAYICEVRIMGIG